MTLQRVLRNYLRKGLPRDVCTEPWCTCGSANHARIFFFRVSGQRVAAIVPEGCELSAAQLRRALPKAQVEPLTEAELDAIETESRLGNPQTLENLLGPNVYLDRNLAGFRTVVFCPQMFSGRAGECFRIPTADFRRLVHAKVVPLFAAFVPRR